MKNVLVAFLSLNLLLACSDDFAKPEFRPFNSDDLVANQEKLPGEDPSAFVKISLKVFLAGPFLRDGSMHTALNDGGLLPKRQPYAISPFWYDGDEITESLSKETVDWILIGILDPVTLEPVARRAALLTANGDIVDLDGYSPVALKVYPDYYVVALYHRNHLGIMSDVLVDFTSGSGVIDFTNRNTGTREVAPGIYAMI